MHNQLLTVAVHVAVNYVSIKANIKIFTFIFAGVGPNFDVKYACLIYAHTW